MLYSDSQTSILAIAETKTKLIKDQPISIALHWVHGQKNVEGNEKSHELARAGGRTGISSQEIFGNKSRDVPEIVPKWF